MTNSKNQLPIDGRSPMKCPVCPRSDIPDDEIVCPNCGVDLIPLRRAHELGMDNYNEALRLERVGATDIAIRCVGAALAMNEQFVPAQTLLGKLLWKKGYLREALGQWQQAAALAPDDTEISSLLSAAQRQIQRRRAGRIVALAGIAILALCLIITVVVLPLRVTSHRLNAMSSRVNNELKSTRIEYVRTAAEADRQRQEAERLASAKLSQALTEISDAVAASQFLRTDMRTERKHVLESLIVVLRTIRPESAEQVSVRIAQLRDELARLRDQEARFEKRGTPAIDDISLEDIRYRSRRARNELKVLESDYKTRVAPWEEALRRLQSELKSLRARQDVKDDSVAHTSGK